MIDRRYYDIKPGCYHPAISFFGSDRIIEICLFIDFGKGKKDLNGKLMEKIQENKPFLKNLVKWANSENDNLYITEYFGPSILAEQKKKKKSAQRIAIRLTLPIELQLLKPYLLEKYSTWAAEKIYSLILIAQNHRTLFEENTQFEDSKSLEWLSMGLKN